MDNSIDQYLDEPLLNQKLPFLAKLDMQRPRAESYRAYIPKDLHRSLQVVPRYGKNNQYKLPQAQTVQETIHPAKLSEVKLSPKNEVYLKTMKKVKEDLPRGLFNYKLL